MNNRSLKYLFIVLAVFFAACKQHPVAVKKSKKAEALMQRHITATIDTAGLDSTLYIDMDFFKHIVVIKETPVFIKPDSDKKIIEILPAMSPIEIVWLGALKLRNLPKPTNINDTPNPFQYWYKIKTPAGLTGYIRQGWTARYIYENKATNLNYLILTDHSEQYNPTDRVKILKYDAIVHKIIDTAGCSKNAESLITIDTLKAGGIKNAQMLFRIKATEAFCGGGESRVLVADISNRLFGFPEGFSSFDDGGSWFEERVFYPSRNEKGQITFAEDADNGYPLTDTATVIKFANEQNISPDELIVKALNKGSYVLKNNGDTVKLKNGQYKTEDWVKTITYYRWDGSALTKLKKVKGELN